jgi:hypothetical protein
MLCPILSLGYVKFVLMLKVDREGLRSFWVSEKGSLIIASIEGWIGTLYK